MSRPKNETSELRDSINFTAEHYENFPVASFLFPKKNRQDVALIYRFARTADDIVDEGDSTKTERSKQLKTFRQDFQSSLDGNYKNTFWKLLHSTIVEKKLSPINFLNLLDAFEQDISKDKYENFEELTGYCEKSANPVGRIILELYSIKDEKILILSDNICTALQLTNFWQDVKIDLKKGRVYIPQDDFRAKGTDSSSLNSEQMSDELRQIVKMEIGRTLQLFSKGSEILGYLPFRLKWQIKWTINGGLKILEKIKKNDFDVLNFKPTLTKFDYIITLVKPLKLNAD